MATVSRIRHDGDRRAPLTLAVVVVGALTLSGVAGAQGDAPGTGPETGDARLDDLSPADMMARYQAECHGAAGRAVARAGAEVARAHGVRCDTLAEAIQALDATARREGSADLARPDFYTPGRQ